MTSAYAQDTAFGLFRVNTGNAFLDIFGLVFIVLAIAFGLALIKRYIR